MARRVRSADPSTGGANEGPDGRMASGGNEGRGGRTAEDRLESFAEDLGRFLGNVQNRATSWLEQRKDIAEQLTQIRDTANQYLQQLGAESARLADAVQRGRRRGRPPGSERGRGPGRPPGSANAPAPTAGKRSLSAEARKRIAQAQRERWAKLKAGRGGKRGGGDVGNA